MDASLIPLLNVEAQWASGEDKAVVHKQVEVLQKND
jgi:hypothetical protein